MAASPDLILADIGRALRARYGQVEGEGFVRPLEPWLGAAWPFPPGSLKEAPSPRAAVAAAELAVLDAFPDRAIDFLVPLGRILAAGVLAEAVTWESVTTSHEEVHPFRRVDSDPARHENVERGFHLADDEGRETLLNEIAEDRAASLVRRRVRLRAGTLDGGRILLTRLTKAGSAELPSSASWMEIVTLSETTARGRVGSAFLVSWMPASHLSAVDAAIARGAPHAWHEDVSGRFGVEAWRPGWIR